MIRLNPGDAITSPSGVEWLVGELVGRGGTAQVHVATSADGSTAVVKTLSGHRFPVTSAMRKRFLREARHLESIDNPHVVRVLGHGSYRGLPFIVMEKMERSLYDVLQVSRIPFQVAATWLRHALVGTAALHDAGLVHRDLSPKNLLIARDGRLVVGDFGTVRHLNDTTITTSPHALGSLIYISTQQFDDPHGARPADDVFSLGQIAYEMLTGHRPLGNAPPLADARPDAPSDVTMFVDRMRSHARERRPGTARAALEEFDALASRSRTAKMPSAPRAVLEAWRIRQLAALERAKELPAIAGVCESLAEVVDAIGPIRLGVDRFRKLPHKEVVREVGIPGCRDRTCWGMAVLLGSGNCRFHIHDLEGGGFSWWLTLLHSRLTGSDFIVVNFDYLHPLLGTVSAAIEDLHRWDDDLFWSCFDAQAFTFGRECAECGTPLELSVPREELDINQGAFGVQRSATCPNEPGVEPPRCCVCGETLGRVHDFDEWGRYDAVGCACGGYAIQVDFEISPWNFNRRLTTDDVPTILEKHIRVQDDIPELWTFPDHSR